MLSDKCSHGVAWGDECCECQLVWDRELVRRWKPEVEAAERRIASARKYSDDDHTINEGECHE